MTYKNSRILLVSSMIMMLVLVPILQAIPAALATSASTGIVIPLYSYPYDGSTFVWNSVNTTKNDHPDVPLFVIINPNSGPCDLLAGCPDPNYKKGIANLTKSGVVVLGYLDTLNGLRLQSLVEDDIQDYSDWYKQYGLKGVFFDQMNNADGGESYYQDLTNYAKGAAGLTYTFGNPGTDTQTSYVETGTADVLDIFENGALPTISGLQAATFATTEAFNKQSFSFLSYAQSSLPSEQLIGNFSNFVGYMYLTADSGSNPWDTIASYLSTLASYLDRPTAIITINSVGPSGPITGYFIGVTQNGTQIPSGGYTPLAYNGTTGVVYHFIPNDFGFCQFDKWQDTGSTNPDRAILVNSTSATFTAVYKNNGGTCQ